MQALSSNHLAKPMKRAILACSLLAGLTLSRMAPAQTTNPANPVISITPTNLNFGLIGVGRTKDLTVTIENVGGGTLGGMITGTNSFLVVSGGAYALTNNQSQTVTIRYSPKAAGNESQLLNFTGGGGASLSANGKAAIPPAAPQNVHIVVQ
jgi:hypothetical protein